MFLCISGYHLLEHYLMASIYYNILKMRLGPLSVVNGILWAVSGEECIEQQTYVFDNIFNQHYWHLFTNGRQMPVHNFLILLFIIWHCFTATWRWLFYMHYVKDNTKPVYTILAYRLIVIGTSRFFCLVLQLFSF